MTAGRVPGESVQSRRLTWPNLRNARDLGGLPLAGGGTTRRGVLVRSDSLARLTPVGLDQMIGAGIATVIDLREEWLVGAEPNPVAHDQRVHYHHISLLPASFPLPVLRGGYAEAIDAAQRRVAEVGRAILRTPGPALIHCEYGTGRTGIVSAILLSLSSVPLDAIRQDYLESFANEPVGSDEPTWPSALLNHLARRHGGAAEYLLAGGLLPTEVERLEGILRPGPLRDRRGQVDPTREPSTGTSGR